jgi:rubredoxin
MSSVPRARPGEAFRNHLVDKADGPQNCPICARNEWATAPEPLTLLVGPGFKLGGEHFPVAPLVCTNCGYVRLFSTVIAGLKKHPVEEEVEGDE